MCYDSLCAVETAPLRCHSVSPPLPRPVSVAFSFHPEITDSPNINLSESSACHCLRAQKMEN